MVLRLLIMLLVLALILGGIFALKNRQSQQMAAQAAMPPPPATVSVVEVGNESWQTYLYAVGSLVATQGIYVTNEVSGQVRSIHFESGQGVKTGDLLLTLDDSVDQADLEGLLAERRLTEVQYKRRARLLKDKSVSISEYDEAKAHMDNASAQVSAKRALIRKKQIRAPFSGLLGIRGVDLGEYLAPGSRIVPLEALNPIFVDYGLPERYFDKLSVDQQVIIQIQAYPGERFTGHIAALNPGIDPGTRSVRVRAVLDNPDTRLRPGMFAEVRSVLPERKNLVTLPQSAITYNPYGATVFVIERSDDALLVRRRQVDTGDARDGRVAISKGLAVGDSVVSAGQVKLRNGQPVKIDNSVQLQ